jgi:hypothetical protein
MLGRLPQRDSIVLMISWRKREKGAGMGYVLCGLSGRVD